jgi:hypothetical protein
MRLSCGACPEFVEELSIINIAAGSRSYKLLKTRSPIESEMTKKIKVHPHPNYFDSGNVESGVNLLLCL